MSPCCQAYLLFRAALAEPYTFGAGSESLEVQLVAPEDIQWEEVRALWMPMLHWFCRRLCSSMQDEHKRCRASARKPFVHMSADRILFHQLGAARLHS
jgi:hypothetical protein